MSLDLVDWLGKTGLPSDTVLESGEASLSRSDLQQRVEVLAARLQRMNLCSVALLIDNGIEWILFDLACQLAGLRVVPLPLFFSDRQIQHAISSSSVDAVVTDRDLLPSFPDAQLLAGPNLLSTGIVRIFSIQPSSFARIPPGTQKITFTSGTTGTPRGVCLSAAQQLETARSLASVINIESPRHLCILPLSTLLENLAGVYAPLMAGGKVIAPPLSEVGLAGSSQLDLRKLLSCIERHQPNSLILVPEILKALTMAADAGWQPPPSLQFVAVGGGKVAPELVRRARDAGIPAYEGYGLSECGSVVSLNVPGADRIGSVGRQLPHVRVAIVNREIVVTGGAFLGYVDQPDSWAPGSVRTGDLGQVDENGFIHVSGRVKHQLITSFGRNLSPEWVESELLAGPLLGQAIVIGDNRPYCVALISPREVSASDEDVANWVRKINLGLPDYARIVDWYRLPAPLAVSDRMLTENGRPRRANIEQTYREVVDGLYQQDQEVCSL